MFVARDISLISSSETLVEDPSTSEQEEQESKSRLASFFGESLQNVLVFALR